MARALWLVAVALSACAARATPVLTHLLQMYRDEVRDGVVREWRIESHQCAAGGACAHARGREREVVHPSPALSPRSFALHAQLTPRDFLSSKTPYAPQGDAMEWEPPPPMCRLAHVNFLGRHGSRHLTKLAKLTRVADALAAASDAGGLTPRGREALAWARALEAAETPLLGQLAASGAAELEGVAARLWARDGAFLAEGLRRGRPFVFEATHKTRTQDSRDAFVAALGAFAPPETPAHARMPGVSSGASGPPGSALAELAEGHIAMGLDPFTAGPVAAAAAGLGPGGAPVPPPDKPLSAAELAELELNSLRFRRDAARVRGAPVALARVRSHPPPRSLVRRVRVRSAWRRRVRTRFWS
jgi:hypothetical protein